MSDAPALHIVTGKGGTGKSTLATALALSLAGAGLRVLLAETESRQSLAPLLGLPSLPYTEVAFTDSVTQTWSGQLHAQSIEPGPALIDYVTMFYSLPGAASFLQRSGATAFVTAIAPGLRDVLITGKIAEAARRPARASKHWAAHTRPDGGYAFDAVVVDAPPTGRIHKFLNVTEAVASVAAVGKVNEHARRIRDVIKHERTVVHVAALAEELPVQETIEAVAQLRALEVPLGAVFLNMYPQDPGMLPSTTDIRTTLDAHLRPEQARTLADVVQRAHTQRRDDLMRAKETVVPLSQLDIPIVELPEIIAESLPELAQRLARVINIDALAVRT